MKKGSLVIYTTSGNKLDIPGLEQTHFDNFFMTPVFSCELANGILTVPVERVDFLHFIPEVECQTSQNA